MKIKILILLPIVFTVGLTLGQVIQVLATKPVPNPGHPAEHIGAGIFADADKYIFWSGASVGIGADPGTYTLSVNGKTWTKDIDVVGNALVTGDLTVNGRIYGSLGQEICQWVTGTLGSQTFCPAGYYLAGSQMTLNFNSLGIPDGIIQKLYCCKP